MKKRILAVFTAVFTICFFTQVVPVSASASGNVTSTSSVEQVENVQVSNNKTSTFSVTWKKISGVDGYQIYIESSNKKIKEKITIKRNQKYQYIKELSSGTTYSVKVRAYEIVDGKKVYGSYSKVVKTATDPKKANIKSIKAVSKSIKVSWNKVGGASGYDVYMSTSKSGKYTKIASKDKNTTSYTKTDLKANKTYYFKVRAYREVEKKKYYGSFSLISSKKTDNVVSVSDLENKLYNKMKTKYTNRHSLEPIITVEDGVTTRTWDILNPTQFNELEFYSEKFFKNQISKTRFWNTIESKRYQTPMDIADGTDDYFRMCNYSLIEKYTFKGMSESKMIQEIYVDYLIEVVPSKYTVDYLNIKVNYNKNTKETTIYVVCLNFIDEEFL